MPIIGPGNPGAGEAPGMTTSQDTNPISQIQQMLQEIESSDIDAFFVDKQNTTSVKFDLNKVEAVLDAYSQSANNPQLFNKWLGLETALTKAMKKFSSDLRLLLAGVTQMGQAQSMLQAQLPGQESGVATPTGKSDEPVPGTGRTQGPGPEQGKFGASEKALPTEGMK
jgi:hypothetical protein